MLFLKKETAYSLSLRPISGLKLKFLQKLWSTQN
jgi:hypothetical protein